MASIWEAVIAPVSAVQPNAKRELSQYKLPTVSDTDGDVTCEGIKAKSVKNGFV